MLIILTKLHKHKKFINIQNGVLCFKSPKMILKHTHQGIIFKTQNSSNDAHI